MSVDFWKTAKQLANKVSDELNKGKWDPNCLNTALFSDDDPNKPTMALQTAGGAPVKHDMTNFQAQINERNERMKNNPPAKTDVPGASGLIPLSELPKVSDPAQSISNIGDKSCPAASIEEKIPPAGSEAPKPEPEKPETITIGRKGSALFPEKEIPLTDVSLCYYVKIVHDKTYPAIGSVNIMRSCDHQYVWQDTQPAGEIPSYDICKGCGKKIGHTEVHMD